MSLGTSALHKWRRLTQVGFGLVFINSYIPVIWEKVLYSGPLRSVCVPVLNCHSCPTALFACPIGMLQHYSAMQQFPFFVLGFLGFVGITSGRAACGWLCPFGLVQDLMYKIRSVKFRIPKFMSYFKYVFLVVLVLLLPYITGTHWFSRLCPWGGIIASVPWVTWNPEHPMMEMPTVPEEMVGFWFFVKLSLIAVFLVLFVVTRRPFCYTSCPLGAIFSFFNKYSMFKIEVDEECTQCNRCKEKCSMDRAAYEHVNNPDCVECLECLECDNVRPRFNLDDAKVPVTTPGPACQTACPVGTEAWRYVAHIQRGELDAAYYTIRKPNPFPSVCARVCHHPCEAKCGASKDGDGPVSIRALKRYVTEKVDPSSFKQMGVIKSEKAGSKIAIAGSGPAGLTAAHYLSLLGYKVTIFEKDPEPGGMLISGIPPYRLPRETLKKEIQALLDENITLKCNTALGTDITVRELFDDDFEAVFLAMGAHKSRKMNIENEDSDGVFPSIRFLKAYNLNGESLAKGEVCVIGGGNSAIDSARMALRQEGVSKVTILYRRTREEMPAFADEVKDAIDEGVEFKFLVTPLRITSPDGAVSGIECIENSPGEPDESGRRRPVPVEGSEFIVKADTVIVAIGEQPDTEKIASYGISVENGGKLITNPKTFETNVFGVFAGGDVVTGPYSVVDAIAAGGKAAGVIDRFVRGVQLEVPEEIKLPNVYIEPPDADEQRPAGRKRIKPKMTNAQSRAGSFDEIEQPFSDEQARCEAGRCRRCDLDFAKQQSSFKKSS